MTEENKPAPADFWKAVDSYGEWVTRQRNHERDCALRAAARPGKKYYMNIIRRISDGKIFTSGDRKDVMRDGVHGYSWSLLELEKPEDWAGRRFKDRPDLETVDGEAFEGNINTVMRIDGEVYESAKGDLSSDWAYYDTDGEEESVSWTRGLKLCHDSDALVQLIKDNREKVTDWLNAKHVGTRGDIRALYQMLEAKIDQPMDDGAMSAAITRWRHYQHTGDVITVCY
jgi:hypothetical protein